MGIWDLTESSNPHVSQDIANWRPEPPPSLDGIIDIQMNFETTGLRWWGGDKPIGMSLRYGDKKRYLPWGHQVGGNLDAAMMLEWARRELRGKRITNTNIKFDIHFARVWGVDLEEQGNQVSDVAHYAGLLNDHRQRFGLDILAKDYLGVVEVPRLDESRMVHYHPAEVAPRSMYNVELVWQLRNHMWHDLTQQGLHKVRQLEDECIFATVEMEKNGAKIDIAKLDQWIIESEIELQKCQLEIGKAIGRRYQETLFEGGKSPDLINPDSPKEMQLLFERLNLPIARTAKGSPSFTGDVLRRIDHPVIKLVIRASKLIDIRIKLVSWAKSVNRKTGILRYALHQLRAQKDKYDELSAGTISGRYSSTKIDTRNDEGTNIQSVMKAARQRIMFGYADDDDSHDDELFMLRRLVIPEEGEFLSADAMQIEYRLFVAETNSERLLKFYRDDPKTSYHKMIHGLLKPFKPDLPYRRAKDVNFAVQYGAGLRKMALMLGFTTSEEYRELLHDNNWRRSPLLKETIEIKQIYDKAVPEVQPMIKKAQQLAEKRGYICSIMGRRSRFPDGERTHKALNTRVQPSAADIMKMKLIEIHKARKQTGFKLRFTVHDEINGDCPNKESANMVNKILNEQSFRLSVDILWETNTGKSWHDLTALKEDEFEGAHRTEPNRGRLEIPGEDIEETISRTHR
jgi:DNA polymerase I-like protein with 3'-5' exonuclease and polymerase domains